MWKDLFWWGFFLCVGKQVPTQVVDFNLLVLVILVCPRIYGTLKTKLEQFKGIRE